MTDTKPTLRDVALKASERVGGLQGRALDREAKRRGFVLSYTTVDKIIAGTYNSRPTAKTLQALSALSGVPLADVYAAANEPMPTTGLAEQLPADADLLEADQRRVVIDTVRVFARYSRELDRARRNVEERETDGATAAKSQAGGSPAADPKLAADVMSIVERYWRAADRLRRSGDGTEVVEDALRELRDQARRQLTARLARERPDSNRSVG